MITHNPKSPLFRFDGINDYVEIPFKSELTPPNLTVELWVLELPNDKHYNVSIPFITVVQPQEFGYRIDKYGVTDSDTLFRVDTLTDSQILFTKIPLPQNVWTHLATTYDPKSQISYFYLNGEQVATFNFTNTHYNPLKQPHTPITSNVLRLGAEIRTKLRDGVTKNYMLSAFNGYMDEVRIWDVVRTQQQIQETINQELTGKEPNLVGYWRFSNLSDNKVPDLTGKGLDGIIIKNENPVTPIPKTQTFEADISSQAGVNFTNTFAQEVSFKISASGTWKPASWGELTPGGWPGFEYQSQMKYPNNTSFALLVVDVETNTVLAELGSEITLVLKPSQTIAFVVNDVPISEGYTDGYKDNTGNISITCTALIS